MKKATKVTLIISLIIFLAGVGLTVFGLYKNDWRIDNLTMQYETKIFESGELFDKIETDLANSNVKIVKADAFSVEYEESKRYPVTIAISNNVLSVKSEKKRQFAFFDWYEKTATIKVPYELSNIDVKTKNGSIGISDFDVAKDGVAGNVKALTTNGNVNLSNIKAAEVNASTTNGRYIAKNIEADKLSLGTTNGDVNAEDCTARYISLTTTNGRISLKRVSADKIDADSTNGNISYNEVTAQKISAETSNGHIEGTGVTVDELTARSTNGSISFEIRGDKSEYNIRLIGHRQNESESVQGSGKKIDCETTSSKCSLSFVGAGNSHEH